MVPTYNLAIGIFEDKDDIMGPAVLPRFFFNIKRLLFIQYVYYSQKWGCLQLNPIVIVV